MDTPWDDFNSNDHSDGVQRPEHKSNKSDSDGVGDQVPREPDCELYFRHCVSQKEGKKKEKGETDLESKGDEEVEEDDSSLTHAFCEPGEEGPAEGYSAPETGGDVPSADDGSKSSQTRNKGRHKEGRNVRGSTVA